MATSIFGTNSATPVEAAPGSQAPMPSKMGALLHAIQGYLVFSVLKFRHRALFRETSSLASHLKEYVFPSLRENRQRLLILQVAEDAAEPGVYGRDEENRLSFPGTSCLALQMKRMDIERISLDTSLEYNQLIESILMLVYVNALSPAPGTGTDRYAGWRRNEIAARMLSGSGFHRFCAVMRLRPSAKEYDVKYSYCEPFFSEMIQRFVRRNPKYDDHTRLVKAAPKLGLLAFLLCMLPLFLLHTRAATAAMIWLFLSGVAAVALGFGVRMIASMQYVREHRDKLIAEYLKEISALSRFPESNPNPQIKLGPDGDVLYANRATRRLLEGLGIGEEGIEEILPPDFRDLLAQCLVDKEEVHESESRTRGKSFRFRFSAFPDEQSFIASGSDITYLKDIENELRDTNLNLEETVQSRTEELRQTQDVIILSLAGLAEMRDPETGEHLERTRRFVELLAQELLGRPDFREPLTREDVRTIYMSAPLHDIGKVGVPDAVLLKPGKLTAEEFDEMKKHAAYGGAVLDKAIENLGFSSFLDIARDIAHHHHEKWDGSGYPSGLEGCGIPLPARIMAVADVYDALTSKRPYKEPWPHEKARNLIVSERGKHFDPAIVDAFIEIESEFDGIAQALREADV